MVLSQNKLMPLRSSLGKLGLSTRRFPVLGRKPGERTEEQLQEAAKTAKVALFNSVLRDAERGNPDAQWKVGDIDFHGHGVERNDEEAIRWYRASPDYGSRWLIFGRQSVLTGVPSL